MQDRRIWFATIALLAVPLAGCLAGDDEAADDDGDVDETPPEDAAPPADANAPANGTGELPPLTMVHHLCRQFHSFFDSPAAAFELPDGFTPAPSPSDPTGLLTTVYVHVSVCPQAEMGGLASGEVQEMWASLIVIPPEELADPNVVFHGIALGAIVSNEAVLAQYSAWGVPPEVLGAGTVGIEDLPEGPPGTLNARSTVTGATGTYELLTHVDTAVQEGASAGAVRIFAVSGGAVTGSFVYAWPGWTDVGLGQGAFTFGGDFLAGGPPVSQGVAHAVLDTDVYYAGSLDP